MPLFCIHRFCHAFLLFPCLFFYPLAFFLHCFPCLFLSAGFLLLSSINFPICLFIPVLSRQMTKFCIKCQHIMTSSTIKAMENINDFPFCTDTDACLPSCISTKWTDNIGCILDILYLISIFAVFQKFHIQHVCDIKNSEWGNWIRICTLSFFHILFTFLEISPYKSRKRHGQHTSS